VTRELAHTNDRIIFFENLLQNIPIATSVFSMQLKLLSKTWAKDRFAFGGAKLGASHAKTKRHFRPKLALHVVIRSSQAQGKRSFFCHNIALAKLLEGQATRHFIKVYAAANAGNHLHLLIQAPSREHLSNFLRALTGRIAQLVDGAKGFWDARPFSRIVGWGRDFKNVARYICINATEATGMSRETVRGMFDSVRQALKQGLLPKTPGLVAAGFV
jgi:REP element-mobilizing transposase RayT